MFKNDARSLARQSLCGSLSKNVDTPVNGRPSLFGIEGVHQMETSLSHAFLAINTKSMPLVQNATDPSVMADVSYQMT
jgi:hypothetical protein